MFRGGHHKRAARKHSRNTTCRCATNLKQDRAERHQSETNPVTFGNLNFRVLQRQPGEGRKELGDAGN
jgi:hypothetical protein